MQGSTVLPILWAAASPASPAVAPLSLLLLLPLLLAKQVVIGLYISCCKAVTVLLQAPAAVFTTAEGAAAWAAGATLLALKCSKRWNTRCDMVT